MHRTYPLHDIPIQFQIDDADAQQRLDEQWAPFLARAETEAPPIQIVLSVAQTAPGPPDLPLVSAGPDVRYFREGHRLSALFPGWGRFDVRLDEDRISGVMAREAIATYGVFEDMILIALAPLLRRRGYYAIHAFAAAVEGRALLILGDTGAGKTTTGISLLARGAKLVANDSPLLRQGADGGLHLYAYPGLLSAYPDSLARYPELAFLLSETPARHGSGKISFPAARIRPDIWQHEAEPAALLFPTLAPDLEASELRPLPAADALARLIAQSIENWDRETIPAQLRALRALVEHAAAYELRLAPDTQGLAEQLLLLL